MGCAICTHLAQVEAGSPAHHYSLATLRRSASRGCRSCRLFLAAVAPSDPAGQSSAQAEDMNISLRWGGEYENGMVFLYASDKPKASDTKKPRVKRFDFEMCSVNGTIVGAFRDGTRTMYGRTISPSFLEWRCFNLAQEWLRSCLHGHQPLCTTPDPVILPTRLLRIREDDGLTLWLFCTSNISSSLKYAALSHCWGTLATFTTVTSNLEIHQSGINRKCLPQSFQDAVTVTRIMGLEYLWIDSICIIQDSKDDWAAESARMGQVFQNATFTIAADSAKNSHEGFLHPRVHGRELAMLNRASEGPWNHDLWICKPRKAFNSIEYEPLNTRGWACQERILSRRILHFTDEQIFWECRSGMKAESYGQNILYTVDMYNKKSFDRLPEYFGRDKKSIPHAWYQSIMMYSRRYLTYPSDKLPALSGLASHFYRPHAATGGNYLAGLWENDFPRCMLWCNGESPNLVSSNQDDANSSTIQILSRTTQYRAPSFSWAAYDGPIQFRLTVTDVNPVSDSEFDSQQKQPYYFEKDDDARYKRQKYLHRGQSAKLNLRLLRIRLVCTTADPYGMLDESSYITVNGMCLSFQYEPGTQVLLGTLRTPASLIFDITHESLISATFLALQVGRKLVLTRPAKNYYSSVTDEENRPSNVVWCLFLKAAGVNSSHYERVGVMEFHRHGEEDPEWVRKELVLR